jgi:hypothetical protein
MACGEASISQHKGGSRRYGFYSNHSVVPSHQDFRADQILTGGGPDRSLKDLALRRQSAGLMEVRLRSLLDSWACQLGPSIIGRA